jgi:hypothetical protein
MKKKSPLIIIVSLFVVLSLSIFFLVNRLKSSSSDNLVGKDRDEHGCIGSAGYSWCEAKQKCFRPWEESCDNGTPNVCGLENCHGLEIVCGPEPAQICTEIYMLGDRCRQHVQCGFVNGICQQEENPQFTACKSCVESCLEKNKDDQIKLFECESRCE